MDSGYYAAGTGLATRTQALDTIANNLANVSTVGFRSSHNIFNSMLVDASQNPFLSVVNQDANDYGVLGSTRLDLAQGTLTPTHNDFDVAVEGPGYFVVKTDHGFVFTRSGNFRLSPKRQLTTESGDLVMGGDGTAPITVVAGGTLTISPDGTISTDGAISGRLRMVEFAPNVQLENAGGNYYSGPVGAAAQAKNSFARQGMLENSNVNPVTSVVELINAQREVETMRHVLSLFSNEMDKTAAQDLPTVSANG